MSDFFQFSLTDVCPCRPLPQVLVKEVTLLSVLGNVSGAVRRGVCGNGVCESGETCHSELESGSDLCCEADCPLVISPCPTSQLGNPMVPCCGRGVCLSGVGGVCKCFAGYEGPDCGQCSDVNYDELTGEVLFTSVSNAQVRLLLRCKFSWKGS